MLNALQSQLTSGPLADLNSGAVDGNGFIQEAQDLAASYAQNVDQQLLPHFTNIDQLLKLQGQAVVADLVALNQQATAGLITSSDAGHRGADGDQFADAGPISSLGTPVSAYASVTQTFVSQVQCPGTEPGLDLLHRAIDRRRGPELLADAEAYRAELHVGLQVTHPNISNSVDQAVNDLESRGRRDRPDQQRRRPVPAEYRHHGLQHGDPWHDRPVRPARPGQPGQRGATATFPRT